MTLRRKRSSEPTEGESSPLLGRSSRTSSPIMDDGSTERKSRIPDYVRHLRERLGMSKARLYSSYVLILLLITYLLNQLDRYMLAIVTKPMAQEIHYGDQACMTVSVNSSIPSDRVCETAKDQTTCETISNATSVCKWDYTGQGYEYQILAGPVFILIYTFAAIPVGVAADLYNRKLLLGFSLIFWSACTLLTGFVNSYWQLAVLRFGLGLGESGCTPFATSLLTDYFPESLRGLALGIYNWGIYTGYSMSYALGNFITEANINGQGWRWAFIISGIPGLVIGAIILLTVREPERKRNDGRVEETKTRSVKEWLKMMLGILRPSVLMLCVAGSIRNAAGYVWAYNTQVYFQSIGQSPRDIGFWMSWIPIVGGSIGVVFGGIISDRVVRRTGPHGRIWVLVLSQLLSAPFAAGVLFLDPPYSYICLIPNYIIGEMWVGVTLAVLVELVAPNVKTTAVAAYFFIISNVGGNMPLLVPPIRKAFSNAGYSSIESLRYALYILFPGEYVLGAALFLVTLFVLRRDLKYIEDLRKRNEVQIDQEDRRASVATNVTDASEVVDDSGRNPGS